MFSADAFYFPAAMLNITLPNVKKLSSPIPALMELRIIKDFNYNNLNNNHNNNVTLTISIDSNPPGIFILDEGKKLKLNEDLIRGDYSGVSKRQTITIRGTSKYEEATNTTINILLTSDKLNCRKYKKNICFWNGAVFRMKKKNSNPINLGPLSSEFYRDLCPDYYVTSYKVVKVENLENFREKIKFTIDTLSIFFLTHGYPENLKLNDIHLKFPYFLFIIFTYRLLSSYG
ncbi:hypothetical protein Phum_PHUM495280 [Pediculus humanus corporis]|uniref:Uncharacterized protein n=1 Tax=Pediculus humanus subsp. corporis TaxID=121224 RepID=E0VX54_PEDHC|nr:uncharacterized protein Phum_PHUM495280 [Pediculus humanus corporis]EEB17960.1 hypothetical protein Phum_PHUM495280 [Pediculus humanus corporis]